VVLLKAKNDGYNTVQTYYFWNAHVPKLGAGSYAEDGWRNLTSFLEKYAAADMFVTLRIGPYVCAEWSWGGYPYDLAQVEGLQTRSHNIAWETQMRGIVMEVVRRYRPFFADRGGPIILGQIENELHTQDSQNYVPGGKFNTTKFLPPYRLPSEQGTEWPGAHRSASALDGGLARLV
jgi:beta-galactosidase GanA